MIEHLRYLWQILVVTSICLLLGILLIPGMELGLPLNIYVISLAAVAAINYFTYLVMARGVGKQNKAGMVYLLGGIGLKFLLYLGFITLVWAITKNLSKGFIITFFALYLFFTFLLAGNLFKILKNK